jgi:hypothetical protein
MPISTARRALEQRRERDRRRGDRPIGIASCSRPYVPSFSSTPARMTEPAVGASVCASGSHVCTGNSGTFTRKPAGTRGTARSAPRSEARCREHHLVEVKAVCDQTDVDDAREGEDGAGEREEEELAAA